jgi:peptidoglycan/LPS O-acetylase OafA/YrhL
MSDRKPLIALDLLRFASALLVVAFHYGTAFALAPSAAGARMLNGLAVSDAAVGASWFGWVGVEIFFVISGFVIAISAEQARPAAFLRRRALRLFPAAWVCASATLIVLAMATPDAGLGLAWLHSIGFWPVARWVDPSYWTLGVELCFYLLIATGLRSADRARVIERRGLAIGALSLIFWLIAAGWQATPMMDYRPFQLLLLPHGCFFALGILARSMLSRGVTAERTMLTVLFYATALAEIAGRTAERTHALHIEASPAAPILIFSFGLAVVLASSRLQPLLERRINLELATTLGLLTYPLYLIHQEVGAAIVAAAMRAGLGYWPAIAVTLAIVLAAACAVAAILEPAIRTPLARLLGARPHVAAGSGSAARSPLPAPARQSAG